MNVILMRTKALSWLGVLAVLTLACQSILGIESDRQVTSPPYTDCDKSKGVCSGCLSSDDKDECEGNSSGTSGTSGGHGGNAGTGGSGNHSGSSNGGSGHGGNGTSGGTNGGGTNGGRPNGGDGNTAGNGSIDTDGGIIVVGDAGDCTATDCVALCLCEGIDVTTCNDTCSVSTCTFVDGCASCESGMGACSCSDPNFGTCFYDPTFGACPGADIAHDCSSCTTSAQQCLCAGFSADVCFNNLGGNWTTMCGADTCSNCSCGTCAAQQLLCIDNVGCQAVVNCYLMNHCSDVNCAACASVVSNNGGLAGASVGFAEAILTCRSESCSSECAR